MRRPLPTARAWVEGWLRDRGILRTPSLPDTARVTTYNIGRGAKGPRGATHATLDRVAATLAVERPDVVGLQEVHEHDVPVLVELLRREHGLRYEACFGPALSASDVAQVAARTRARAQTQGLRFDAAHYADRTSAYGVATLSLAPLDDVRVVRLPGSGEARVALRARTSLDGRAATVVTTHLATRRTGARRGGPSVRELQTRALLELAATLDGPVIVLGDLNQPPDDLTAVQRTVGGAGLVVANDVDDPTHGGDVIDYVLVPRATDVLGRRVGPPGASDHRPVTVALRLP